MTIQELFEWAFENHLENYQIMITHDECGCCIYENDMYIDRSSKKIYV